MVIKADSPASIAEQFIVESIWNHRFAPGSALPAERELSELIGVTRTTLREVLQRLARDGWLTIQHGRPTLVNNIWETSGLNMIEVLVTLDIERCPEFINHMLSARTNISIIYIRAALRLASVEASAMLRSIPTPEASAQDFSAFDYNMHHELARLSGNPIYVLILNSFQHLYRSIGHLYFQDSQARSLAREFYRALGALSNKPDGADEVLALCRTYGKESGLVWRRLQASMPEDWPEQLIEILYKQSR